MCEWRFVEFAPQPRRWAICLPSSPKMVVVVFFLVFWATAHQNSHASEALSLRVCWVQSRRLLPLYTSQVLLFVWWAEMLCVSLSLTHCTGPDNSHKWQNSKDTQKTKTERCPCSTFHNQSWHCKKWNLRCLLGLYQLWWCGVVEGIVVRNQEGIIKRKRQNMMRENTVHAATAAHNCQKNRFFFIIFLLFLAYRAPSKNTTLSYVVYVPRFNSTRFESSLSSVGSTPVNNVLFPECVFVDVVVVVAKWRKNSKRVREKLV